MFLKASPVTDPTAENYRNLAYRNLVLIGGKKKRGRETETDREKKGVCLVLLFVFIIIRVLVT